MSKTKLKSSLKEFRDGVESLKSVDFDNLSEPDRLLSLYNEISAVILDSKGVPKSVNQFISGGCEDIKGALPEEYSALSDIKEFYSKVRKSAEENIEKALEKGDFNRVIDIFSKSMKVSVKNIVLIEKIAQKFKEDGLFDDLTELYKIEFVYTLNPLVFEKIGDIHSEKGDYNSAIDSYLSCAEISEDYVQIYKKLADLFGKTNDEKSKNACLEQIKRIENGL